MAGDLIDEGSAELTIRSVAERLGVTRQTVYRYFPSTEALLVATAEQAAAEFLSDLAEGVREMTDPAQVVVEGVARAIEGLRENRRFSLFFDPDTRTADLLLEVTSPEAVDLGRSLLSAADVDWTGWTETDMNELVEHLLRTLQSFILDAGQPVRTGDELRQYLDRWMAAPVASRGVDGCTGCS